MEKPTTIDQYLVWAKRNISVDWDPRAKRYYEAVSEAIRRQFEGSKLWQSFSGRLNNLDAEYLLKTSYQFRPPNSDPSLYIKPYKSLVEKAFRKDVLQNPNWPDAPSAGWIKPDNFHCHIKDIVRTSITVKYLDGVELVALALQKACEDERTDAVVSLEARDYGYYAGHVDVKYTFEIPTQSWDTTNFVGSVEVQITTQVKEVIKQLTHKYYEERRVLLPGLDLSAKKWQWDYKGEEFVANYLGHILHYLEGMILDLRDRR